MKTRKLIVLLLVVVFLFAGCSKPAAPAPSASPGTSKEAASAELKPKGKIVVWYSGDSEKRIPLMDWAKKEFEAKNPGTEVIIEVVPYAELAKKEMTACQSGNGPDVMTQSNAWTKGFIDLNLLAPVDDYMKRAGRNIDKEFNPSFFDLMKKDGKIYGMPMSRTAIALVYNKDMFKAAGLDPDNPPKNWAELQAAAKALTKDTNGDGKIDQYGLGIFGTDPGSIWFRFLPEIWGLGGDIVDKDMKKATIDSPQTREALKYYTSYFFDGYAPGSTPTNGQNEVRAMLAAKSVAMMLENYTAIKANVIDKTNINVGVTMWPGKDGIVTAGAGGWNLVIPKSAKNPDGGAAFMALVTGAEGMKREIALPALDSERQNAQWNTPILDAYKEQLAKHCRDFAPFQNTAKAQDILLNMVQSVLTKSATIDQAVVQAQKEMQELLDLQNKSK